MRGFLFAQYEEAGLEGNCANLQSLAQEGGEGISGPPQHMQSEYNVMFELHGRWSPNMQCHTEMYICLFYLGALPLLRGITAPKAGPHEGSAGGLPPCYLFYLISGAHLIPLQGYLLTTKHNPAFNNLSRILPATTRLMQGNPVAGSQLGRPPPHPLAYFQAYRWRHTQHIAA